MDPDTFQPTLSFLYVKGLPSQDVDGIVKAIKSAFSIHDLHHLLQKLVFIASDGASVNSDVKGGIESKFRKRSFLGYLSFGVFHINLNLQYLIACMIIYHLSKKQCLHNLFYLYEKSSQKKLRELCLLHKTFKNIYEFQNKPVKPEKLHCTQWISHVVRSMTSFVDKFEVYIQHIENVISNATKYCDKATLEGKRRQMVEAEMFLKYSIFIDILDSAKNFSLASQYKDIDIILLVERIDDMKLSYQLFANKSQASPESV